MTIIEKLNNGQYEIGDLENYLSTGNAIVLYNTMHEIIDKKITDPIIIQTLISISGRREQTLENKMLGFYTVGDFALATLKKLGIDLASLKEYTRLDSFEKELIDELAESGDL
ncbi:hypothetical protein [Listeria booriae]|uniref:Uncharacterized protein n=1 Tax=Listeria booriae TaxID=1552123 RepID=A0A7X0YKY4_9LIST|nr:hypothetical protein [Listeria booriae]MBC2116210.1 hypothetical protein [Listeria booriae]